MATLHDFLLIFLPLFVVMDPAGMLPVYAVLTMHFTDEQRHQIAIKATLVAGVIGILFLILGQAIFNFLGVHFADFQIAGGILLVILAILDLLSPGKPAVNAPLPAEQVESISVVPLAVPLIVGPATMTTGLLLVNTYSKPYNEHLGAPYGQIVVVTLVAAALLLNLAILFASMWYSSRLVAFVGKDAMAVVNKIVMILLAAFAVSLIRQGIVSIVSDLRQGAPGSENHLKGRCFMHESETSAGLSSHQKTVVYQPGSIVRVTQQIARRYDALTTTLTGKVLRQERQKSGSWYARNPRGKIWLDRLILEKADGEISILNLDEYSQVEVLEGPPALRGEGPMVLPSQDATASVT